MSMTVLGARRLLQLVGAGSVLCGIVGVVITGGMVYIASQRMFILPVVAAYHSLYVVAIINLLWLGTLVWYGTRLLRGETTPYCRFAEWSPVKCSMLGQLWPWGGNSMLTMRCREDSSSVSGWQIGDSGFSTIPYSRSGVAGWRSGPSMNPGGMLGCWCRKSVHKTCRPGRPPD